MEAHKFRTTYLLYIDESHVARPKSRDLLLKNDKNRSKTAQNHHIGGLVIYQISKFHFFPKATVWCVKNHLKNKKTDKTAQKPPHNRHTGGLAVFEFFEIYFLTISMFNT